MSRMPPASSFLAWMRARPRHLGIVLAGLVLALSASLAFIVWRTSLPTLGLYLVPLVGAFAAGVILAFYAPQRTYLPASEAREAPARAFAWAFLAFVAIAALTLIDARMEKPATFYLAFGLAAFCLIVIAATSWANDLHLGFVIIATSGLVTLFGLATHLLTPTNFGADAPFHRGATTALLESRTVDAIVQPYSSFAAYQILIAMGVGAGIPLRLSVSFVHLISTFAIAVAVALMTRRAFGIRAAMIAVSLIAVGTGFLSLASSPSPSKAGIWTIVLLAFLLTEGSLAATLAGLGIAFAGFLYHPIIGICALLAMGAFFLVFSVARIHLWLPPLARLVGFPGSQAPRGLVASPVSIPAIIMVVVIVTSWIVLREPGLTRAIAAIFAFQGDQSGTLGVVRPAAPTLLFIAQTLLVNLASMLLLVPGAFVVINTYLSPERPPALFLVTILAGVLGFLAALTAAGLFLIGPERFLMLQETLLVCVGGAGLALFAAALRSTRGRAIAAAALVAFCLANVTSYRTDGNDVLSSEIPKQTDQTTLAIKAMVDSLRPRLSINDTIVMDNYASRTAAFPSHSEATFYNDPVPRFSMGLLLTSAPPARTLYVWDEYGAARSHEIARWEQVAAENDILYDNGEVIFGRFGPPALD